MPNSLWTGARFLRLGFALVLGLIAFKTVTAIWPEFARNLAEPYPHFDAFIPIGVAKQVWASGVPDTNWAHADLPNHFKYPQYNFSSYNLSFAGFSALLSLRDAQELATFSLVCWIAALGLVAWMLQQSFGALAAVTGTCLVLLSPLLVQDAFYGRPESFFLLMTLAVVALSLMNMRAGHIAACGVAGFALACKISFLPFAAAAIAMPVLLDGRAGLRWSVLGAPALAVGFVAGAPMVLVDPDGFLNGVRYLQKQYSDFHWPHGSGEAGLVPQLAHAIAYYAAILSPAGLVLIFASSAGLAASVLKGILRPDPDTGRRARSERHLLMFVVAAAATVLIFSSQKTFFERNVSHALAVLWLPVGWATGRVAALAGPPWRVGVLRGGYAALALVTAFTMSLTSERVAQVIAIDPRLDILANARKVESDLAAQFPGVPKEVVFAYQPADAQPMLCDALSKLKTKTIIKLVTNRGPDPEPAALDPRLARIAFTPGPFDRVPISTLHVYHSAQQDFYLATPDAPLSPEAPQCP